MHSRLYEQTSEDDLYVKRIESEERAQKASLLKAQFHAADQILTFVATPEDQRVGELKLVWPDDANYVLVRYTDGRQAFIRRGDGLGNIESYVFITVLDDPDEALRIEKAYQALVHILTELAPEVPVGSIAFRLAHEAKREGKSWSETATMIRDAVSTEAKAVLERKLSTVI